MLDNRFPWMCRIDEAPVCPTDRKRASRFLRAVNARTGVNGCYNRRTGGLFLYYGTSPDLAAPARFRSTRTTGGRSTPTTVDNLRCGRCGTGHRTRVEKEELTKPSRKRTRRTIRARPISSSLTATARVLKSWSGFLDRETPGREARFLLRLE
jgi:hypothetical protein